MVFMFVNDNDDYLRTLSRIFRDHDNVILAECHSVDEAMEAICKHQPDTLFLDHSLTEGGDEGLEIARRVKGMKIYSTTARNDVDVIIDYQVMGIDHIKPTDLITIKSIINQPL